MRYIGLDFETTGLDPLQHVPLSLGLAWEEENTREVKSNEFRYSFPGTKAWDSEAMYINKLDPNIYADTSNYARIYGDEADWRICQFLMNDLDGSPFDKFFIPVGWNVGGFDMRFMQTFFPQASKFFSHRYLELNSLKYAADKLQPGVDHKKAAKNFAEQQSDSPQWHNAEWDAKASLYAKQYFDSVLAERA